MERKKLIAANWKMNLSRGQVQKFFENITAVDLPGVDIVICPSLVHLQLAESYLKKTKIFLGAQNLYLGKNGAFTGEVSGDMLKDYGCRYVIVGHSERRQIFTEDLKLVAEKFKAAQTADLIPILCMGETLEERQQGKTKNIIREQLASIIEAASIDAFQKAVIAYEPIWAIGTGLTAKPDEAETVHAFIRSLLAEHDQKVANKVQILYGGSVKADNAQGLFTMPNIDGALVGGASLEARSFLEICEAARIVCHSEPEAKNFT